MTTPTKYEYSDLLNRLSEMQDSPYYATAKRTLAQAEHAIVSLERDRAARAAPPAASDDALSERMRAALLLAVAAMRAPLDGWKGTVERRALDAARAVWWPPIDDEPEGACVEADRAARAAPPADAQLIAERDAAVESMNSCLGLVADLRAALGDDGRRMQPELIEYAKQLSMDAERYRAALIAPPAAEPPWIPE